MSDTRPASRSAPVKEEDRLAKLSLGAVRRIVGLARPESATLVGAGLAAIVGSVVTLALPLVARSAVDDVVRTRDLGLLNERIGLVAALVMGATVFGFIQFLLAARAGNRIVAALRERLFGHLLRLPTAFFDRNRSGDLSSHLTNDVAQVQEVLARDLVSFPGNLLTLFGGIGVALYLDVRLTLVVVGLLVTAMVFFVVFGRALRKLTREGLDALALATGGMTEALSQARLVKAFAREEHETARASVDLARVLDLQLRAAKWEGLMGAVAAAGFLLVVLGVTWYGGSQVVTGRLTTGELFAFLATVTLISGPMGALASLYTKLQRAVAAGDRVFGLLDEAPEPPSPETAPPEGPAEVTLCGLVFGYDPDRPVLKGLDLVLKAGTTTALVGASGGGKSTVASLLFRLYEPQGGQLEWNGVPYAALNRDRLREAIALVPQDASLFSGSLRENIRYGRLGASDAEIEAAGREANVEEFARALPDGYDTLVGERGVTLSGGQRQRVAIARAVLKDPRLLVLDEATSALDTASEEFVQEALARLMRGRTTLVIAHRLSTVREADVIAVLDDGVVAESGRHETLVARQGVYARLARELVA